MKTLLPIIYLSFLNIALVLMLSVLTQEINKKRSQEHEFTNLRKKMESNLEKTSCIDHYVLGKAYTSKKLFNQAIIQFSQSLRKWSIMDPIKRPNLHNAIGFSYFQTGQLDKAIYHYKEAISNNPQYVTALNNLGYSYEKKKMIEEAIKTYTTALLHDNSNETAKQKIESLTRRIKNRDDRI